MSSTLTPADSGLTIMGAPGPGSSQEGETVTISGATGGYNTAGLFTRNELTLLLNFEAYKDALGNMPRKYGTQLRVPELAAIVIAKLQAPDEADEDDE